MSFSAFTQYSLAQEPEVVSEIRADPDLGKSRRGSATGEFASVYLSFKTPRDLLNIDYFSSSQTMNWP